MEQLKILVQQSLEKKGVLREIKASLRKHVFEVIQKETSSKAEHVNEKIKNLHTDEKAKLCLDLIREFLVFYELDYTLSLLKVEAEIQPEHLRPPKRPSLGLKFGLNAQKPNPDTSLLEQILTYNKTSIITETDNQDNIQKKTPRHKTGKNTKLQPTKVHELAPLIQKKIPSINTKTSQQIKPFQSSQEVNQKPKPIKSSPEIKIPAVVQEHNLIEQLKQSVESDFMTTSNTNVIPEIKPSKAEVSDDYDGLFDDLGKNHTNDQIAAQTTEITDIDERLKALDQEEDLLRQEISKVEDAPVTIDFTRDAKKTDASWDDDEEEDDYGIEFDIPEATDSDVSD
eukprot:UN26491